MGRRAKLRPATTGRRPRWIRLRPRVGGAILVLAAIGAGAHWLWQRNVAIVAGHPQYRITSEQIHITPPPPWIRSDIKSQVLRDSGINGSLSVLDDWGELSRRVREAFEFHPWTASVERITKRLPAALEIELEYRRPIAAVESRDAAGIAFLPIDRHAVRLPEADFTDVERRYLPRISGVTGRPLVGDAWSDPRVVGGAKLIAALAEDWHDLRLVEVIAALQSPQGETPRYTFEMVTTGGTRIVWGAPPGQEAAADEAAFADKRRLLLEYAEQHADLQSIDGPASIDVRRQLIVKPPRTVRRGSPAQSH